MRDFIASPDTALPAAVTDGDCCILSKDELVTPMASLRVHARRSRSPWGRAEDFNCRHHSPTGSSPCSSPLARAPSSSLSGGVLTISGGAIAASAAAAAGARPPRTLRTSQIIGVSFEVHAEKAREAPVGRVTVVLEAPCTPPEHRRAWALLAAYTAALAALVGASLGLWSCIAVTAATALDVARSAGRRDTWLGVRVAGGAAAAAALAARWALCCALPRLLRRHLALSGAQLALGYTALALALGAAAAAPPRLLCEHLLAWLWPQALRWKGAAVAAAAAAAAQLRGAFAAARVWRPPPLPLPVAPLVLEFTQYELGQMFEVRALLWESEDTRGLVRDVWIGGAAVETVLSLLPAQIYASRRLRWGARDALDIVRPAFAASQHATKYTRYADNAHALTPPPRLRIAYASTAGACGGASTSSWTASCRRTPDCIRRLRWGLHVLLDYFLPAYTVLQGLCSLLPFLGRHAAALLALLRGDVGVRLALRVLRAQRQVAEAVARHLCASLAHALAWARAHTHAGTSALILRCARAAAGPARGAAAAAAAAARALVAAVAAAARAANTAALRFLLPSDYVFVYLRAKLAPVRLLAQSWSCLRQVAVAAVAPAAHAWTLAVGLCKACVQLGQWAVSEAGAAFRGSAQRNACTTHTVNSALTCPLIGPPLRVAERTCGALSIGHRLSAQYSAHRARIVVARIAAQVGKKVADEGNRLARHVSMKRRGGGGARHWRGSSVSADDGGSSGAAAAAVLGARQEYLEVRCAVAHAACSGARCLQQQQRADTALRLCKVHSLARCRTAGGRCLGCARVVMLAILCECAISERSGGSANTAIPPTLTSSCRRTCRILDDGMHPPPAPRPRRLRSWSTSSAPGAGFDAYAAFDGYSIFAGERDELGSAAQPQRSGGSARCFGGADAAGAGGDSGDGGGARRMSPCFAAHYGSPRRRHPLAGRALLGDLEGDSADWQRLRSATFAHPDLLAAADAAAAAAAAAPPLLETPRAAPQRAAWRAHSDPPATGARTELRHLRLEGEEAAAQRSPQSPPLRQRRLLLLLDAADAQGGGGSSGDADGGCRHDGGYCSGDSSSSGSGGGGGSCGWGSDDHGRGGGGSAAAQQPRDWGEFQDATPPPLQRLLRHSSGCDGGSSGGDSGAEIGGAHHRDACGQSSSGTPVTVTCVSEGCSSSSSLDG
ncbi:hypothetical protein JKP88DRAFT_249758 [Tribonema minus]|uniref:Uncharacterized protein n=1 Tax=Tribonema minus TaxID=303371 RepID=A0A836C8H9_9STRA|nr:hypothetical protein JKP88DRAFT_249758 [Tribonema minus]